MIKCNCCENEFEIKQLKEYERSDCDNYYICLGCIEDGEYGYCKLCGDEKVYHFNRLTQIDDHKELEIIYSHCDIDCNDVEDTDIYLCNDHYDEVTTEIGVDDAESDMFPDYDEDEKEEYYQS